MHISLFHKKVTFVIDPKAYSLETNGQDQASKRSTGRSILVCIKIKLT